MRRGLFVATELTPTTRFSNLAETYAKHRPSYPAAAIDYIVTTAELSDMSLVADIGAGTGISTRLLAERGIPVIGIEPNEPMRTQAEQTSWPGPGPQPRYQNGTGEATGLPDASCDAVLSAQAFHWFDGPHALAEFERILKPGGWVFLMWNERDPSAPFTRAYGDVFLQFTDAAEIEGKRYRAGDILLNWPHLIDVERVSFKHKQVMDEAGLIGRAASVSYAPSDPVENARLAADLRALFGKWQKDGHVVLHYVTTITAARKAPTAAR